MPENRPILFKTELITCANSRCRASQGHYPLWAADFDKGYSCRKCGCTSTRQRPGRPIGPRSRYWEMTLKEFLDLNQWMKDDEDWPETNGAVYAEAKQ